MRPLKLRLNGLRSYRSEQEIDFTGVDLMAIVGDTGAGKSSLLEALCVALYGCCTWDARGAKPLIADGATTLQVELTFRAGDETWRVTRAVSRGAYPPPIHLLECIDSGARVDNADPVNASIRRLVGLDFPTFLKAVVLPQGRFQILLQMSNTDRTPILKSILGLDQLSAVRECALELSTRLRPQLADLQQRRAMLLADPAASAEDARRRLDAATADVATFENTKAKIAAARIQRDEARIRADAARAAAEQIRTAAVQDAAQTYSQLVALDAQLEADQDHVGDKVEVLELEERTLQGTLDTADTGGVGPTQLASAAASLAAVIGDFPEVESERNRCDTEADALEKEREALSSKRSSVASVAADAELAEAEAKSAEEATSATTGELDTARIALRDARLAIRTAGDTETRMVGLVAALAQQEQEASDADELAQAAENAHKDAIERLNAVRRAAAAAHAASASHAGDPCPICDRALPKHFVPPTPPGEEEAQTSCARAEREVKAQAKRATAAITNRDNARASVEDAQRGKEDAERDRSDAIQQATSLLACDDLNRPDDELLKGKEATAAKAAAMLLTARAGAQTKRDAATRADAEIRPVGEALTRREAELTAARRALGRRETKIRTTLASLPSGHRVAETFTAAELRQHAADIEKRQQEFTAISQQLTNLRTELMKLRAASKELDVRRRSEIVGPREELRRRVERLADRAAEAAALLGEGTPPEQPKGSLGDESQWAEVVVLLGIDLAERSTNRADAEEAVVATAKERISATFEAVAVRDDTGLDARLIAASADERVAKAELQLAESHAPIASDLDVRIAAGSPFIDTLDELARLLADGKFVGAVVRRKQRALLGVASELLVTMTGGRFGFAEDFQIVDRLSGQPRDVKTLSGGETFLASLALALALVELAGRGGGRLEALFLDEGFGSLDASSLVDALDALGRQAEGGRLVAVISHLRAVAENIEHVLVVTKGVSGSETHWARGAERDQLINEEIQSGLVA